MTPNLTIRLFRPLLVAALLLLPAGRPNPAAADDAPAAPGPSAIIGRWDLVVHTHNGGTHPAWLEVRRSGTHTLVGSYVGEVGSARPISRVEWDKGLLRFALPPQWEQRSDDQVFEGKLEGKELRGETTDSDGNRITWEGRRAPTLKREHPPKWGEPVELFNGKDLSGWKPRDAHEHNGWVVRDGLLSNEKPGNDLVSERTFTDFQLHAEFRYPRRSNSGIYLRGRYELQIEDGFGLEPDSQLIGGIYGFLTPSSNPAKRPGEWQTMDITLVGRAVTVVFNGERVIDRQAIPGITGGALDSDEGAPGPVMLQGDHGPIDFRKVTITPAQDEGGAHALGSGIDRANFDTSVQPGQDFFQYVNGNWIKNNPIPPEYSRWGAFPQLRDNNLVGLRQILDQLAGDAGALDPDRRKLRDLYHSATDEAALARLGVSPLAPELERVAKVSSRDELVAEVGRLHASGVDAMFSFGASPDEKQSDHYAAHLRQGGLGLPERGYYLGTTDDSKRIRGQYREHVAKMLALLGDSPEAASAGADVVLDIETKLAEASRAPVQLRDREANYNKKDPAALADLTPALKWDVYFHAVGLPDGAAGVPYAIVGQPEFFTRLNEMLGSVPLKDWQTYLRWHLVHSLAAYLSPDLEQENFRFYDQTLRGVKEMQPRWKRAVETLDGLMGEALGRLYVEKYFPPEAKRRMDELVKNVMDAYRERIESRPWMGEETRKQALAKLALVSPKIGYPKRWRDYTDLEIVSDSYAANVMRARAFEVHYRLSRLGKPVDREEWGMTPPTVNAYYNATMNEIVFPAGILQPPFFDPSADDAVNYGAIGSVIGHEITHGFDDQGSRSDGHGNLKDWWTKDDREHFTALSDRLVKQFDACVALDDLHVNGKLTLGENLADLGGVAISYAAWQKSLAGRPAPVLDGFTGPQRFFVGYAQVWRGATRDAEQRLRLRTDPHSPPRFRTLVPLSNIRAFYEAFGIKPGDAMYRAPEDRVEVW